MQFRQTFEQATVGITHVSLEGEFLKVNSKLCQILGYTSQELMKLTFQEITYSEDLALDEKYVAQIMAQEKLKAAPMKNATCVLMVQLFGLI